MIGQTLVALVVALGLTRQTVVLEGGRIAGLTPSVRLGVPHTFAGPFRPEIKA
ncbi:MAG: hypothetical protein V2I43_04400 [Parvularcula sp.]|nr:hypothetical protein [Parvularcula sp.]